jgi:hypothetical protein
MYNGAISPLAAVAGLDNGQLLTMGKARGGFFEILGENYGILNGTAAGNTGSTLARRARETRRRPERTD